MKKLLLATTIVAFGVSPVMAQSTGTQTDTGTSNAASTNDSAASSSSSASISAEDMVASQEKVLKALETAGYSDAAIMDAAYMVQARTPDGETVLMMIDTSGRVIGAQRASSGNAQSGSSASGSDAAKPSSTGESK
ncbi:hypothetical protein [Aurantimonas sp. HBX-1]|uniref:hypothetical protein n=1 Tax=Aurantimonas sp. HBX-1 TaxID=2906072 RepID=UPI001F1E39AC|nr:hypothetical protein [Aurantimonas sp. HBX-1]UIJ70997.1 hypothetical protein LXB15_14865 [Aurantimonas sp. HBX-1]